MTVSHYDPKSSLQFTFTSFGENSDVPGTELEVVRNSVTRRARCAGITRSAERSCE
jgi:hypothetical protein